MITADKNYLGNFFLEENNKLLRLFKDDGKKKYKTEICKNWQNGICKFGANCIFAHGKRELRESVVKKNVECTNFSSKFYCSYGEKCQFIHNQVRAKSRLGIFMYLQTRSE